MDNDSRVLERSPDCYPVLVARALKVRKRTAQGGGERSESKPWVGTGEKASPVRAAQIAGVALRRAHGGSVLDPEFRSTLARAPPPWALLFRNPASTEL